MEKELKVDETIVSKTVMLVEDDIATQELFTHVLERITTASLYGMVNNGVEALEYLKKAKTLPDLIFMDTNMPIMDGIECLGELLNNKRLKKIPVVMLSNAIDKATIAKYLGAKGFIKKPHDHRELQERLEGIIELDFSSHNYIADLSFQLAQGAY